MLPWTRYHGEVNYQKFIVKVSVLKLQVHIIMLSYHLYQLSRLFSVPVNTTMATLISFEQVSTSYAGHIEVENNQLWLEFPQQLSC